MCQKSLTYLQQTKAKQCTNFRLVFFQSVQSSLGLWVSRFMDQSVQPGQVQEQADPTYLLHNFKAKIQYEDMPLFNIQCCIQHVKSNRMYYILLIKVFLYNFIYNCMRIFKLYHIVSQFTVSLHAFTLVYNFVMNKLHYFS